MDDKPSSTVSDAPTLFELPACLAPGAAEPSTPPSRDPKRGARLREANRSQMAWGRIDLEAQLPDDHVARAIWAVVERLDLSAFYKCRRSRGTARI